METGGIQTAFRNLIAELTLCHLFSITVIFLNKNKVKSGDFPPDIEIMDVGDLPQVIMLSNKQTLKKSIYLFFNRLFAGFFAKYISQKFAYIFLFRKVKIDRQWDVAVSFAQSSYKSLYGGMNELVINYIRAEKKIAFIHCDFNAVHLNNAYSYKIYSKFDKIALVSNGVKKIFDDAIPSLRAKTFVVYNCHDYSKIRRLAELDPIVYSADRINFISVARMSKEKGLIRILPIIKRMNEEGLLFRWHVVGGGNYKYISRFNKLVKNMQLESVVLYYGSQDNPYRYMKNADILIVPSYHEAAPMVFQEAECLNLPILTTQTCSAKEFVSDRSIGIVCENEESSIYESMRKIILNRNNMVFNFSSQTSNTLAVSQFMDLLK